MDVSVHEAGGTVLVVSEDQASVRDLVAGLGRRGLSSAIVRSGQEAVAAALMRRPDLIVADIEGSGEQGDTVVALKADDATRYLPIVALASGPAGEQRRRGLPWGVEQVIPRSLAVEECVDRLEVWVRIGRLRREALVRDRALAALCGIAISLSSPLNLKETLERALGQVLELVGMDAGIVHVFDQAGREVRVASGRGGLAAELDSIGSRRVVERFARTAARSERPVLIPDTSAAAPESGGIETIPGVRSAAGVPLVSKERAVGAATLFGRHPRAFSAEEEGLLAGLGHQLGVVVENARLLEETSAALARSNLLYELSNQLHSIQTFDDAVQMAAEQIREAFRADGTLIVLEQDRADIPRRATRVAGDRREWGQSSTPDVIARAVVAEGRPILIPQAETAPGHLATAVRRDGVEALLAVPIQGLSGRHGAVALTFRQPKVFRPLDVETLVVYANHLGIALENARLYADAKQRTERISTLNRLTRVISASLDIGSVYQVFAQEVKHLIPYDRMGVVVPDDAGRGLTMLQLAADGPTSAKTGSQWLDRAGTGIEWVMTRRQPRIERDLAEERRFVEDEFLLSEGIRSLVRLPLIARGKVVGALFLDSCVPNRYSERELDLLVPLAEQLAIVIHNARLFEEINRLAITDELTGLYNRRHFFQQLEQEFKRARRYSRPLSLIMVDIDNFKRYNDLNGHLAGDQALRLIAARLRSITRAVDLLTRYGGDEFGIILPETDLSQAGVQAERVRAAMEQGGFAAPEQRGGDGLTASLGVACFALGMLQGEDLVRAADQALYRSKAEGGNRVTSA
jgi:diguanylate cyclase (GGDEF)-like protein